MGKPEAEHASIHPASCIAVNGRASLHGEFRTGTARERVAFSRFTGMIIPHPIADGASGP
ncbi:MAG: hypothetical protein GMKNLPBB_00365 [Myxococcota bacterium]|nr:hypothetical protein [Myxococcota bacterium]